MTRFALAGKWVPRDPAIEPSAAARELPKSAPNPATPNPIAERPKTKRPRKYVVVFHNDDYTTMEFVVWVLESVFNMPEDQAIQVMLSVHLQGSGVAGIYTFEVAEMKVDRTIALAREQEFPLLATLEPA